MFKNMQDDSISLKRNGRETANLKNFFQIRYKEEEKHQVSSEPVNFNNYHHENKLLQNLSHLRFLPIGNNLKRTRKHMFWSHLRTQL